jgi:hypothetical protein
MRYLPNRDVEAGPDYAGGVTQEKQRRYRRPWVYKSDYDQLAFKYNLLKWASVAIGIGLLFVIKFS